MGSVRVLEQNDDLVRCAVPSIHSGSEGRANRRGPAWSRRKREL